MSISSEHSVVYLMGNGTAQRFDFDFRIFAKGDLSVYVDGALQTLDSDYEVKSDTLLPDGITYDWSSGGYVYFDPGNIPADGSVITISRKLAFTQHLDLQPGGEIPPENVERALDKLTMISQELKDELERTISHPMMFQYSIDGETGWTSEPTSAEFVYFRVSADGGLTWSKPLLFEAELMNFLIGDQIVDGVTDKAPSQNAVHDALAAKTDKAILTTKGDLYVRDATGVTRLPIGSDNQVLTADSGQTSGIKWASPAGVKYQIFTSDGTFTVPSGVTSVKVTLIGGGGGGGYNGLGGSGGGGGGGVYYRQSQSVTSGSNITVTVGLGGAGSSTSNGGAGGTSSFGTYLSATGGGGGRSNGNGGAAGSPATAHYTEAGFGGTLVAGGPGGSTMFGIGGFENRRAIGYGSGGGGGRSGSTGGNGAPGVCIVEWEE